MKKTKLTRSLLAACSIVALTAVMYGCTGDDGVPQTTHDQEVEDKEKAKAEAAELREQINALRAQLGLPADGNISTSIADLQAELKRLQDEKQARDDKEQADKDKAMAAEARKLALGLDAASHFDATDAGTLMVSAMHGKMATLGGADGTGFFADADTIEPMFKAANSKSLAAMNGWSGTELMSMVDNGPTDVVHVYTNVEPDDTVPFAQWAGVTDGVALANGVVTIADGNSALIKAAPFATGSGSKTHKTNVNTDADAVLEVFQTSGTFGGASGTYTCNGDGTQTCTSAVTGSDGGVILGGTGATWTFTPNSGAMAMVPDSEYQNFGWWLRKTDDGYTVHAFSGSRGGTDISNIAPVGGTATYTGPAAGKYSIYDSGPKGGHFTATVELKADFGTTATGSEGTISGMVDNFMGDTAGMDTWMVTLPELNLAAAGTFAIATSGSPTDAEKTTWSIDGEDGAQGTTSVWSGSLRSANAGGTPQVAIGTFSADYGLVGNMRGAFGATHSGE